MIKSIMGKKRVSTKKKEAAELLQLELSEIEELSSLLMSRIDERIKRLKEVENRIDHKLQSLESMITRLEMLRQEQPDPVESRYQEVLSLASKGLKLKEIAHILDMPEGEIELILSMNEE